MAKWRSLHEYTPFARLLVEYMWEQRPPLLPNQFADLMGVHPRHLTNASRLGHAVRYLPGTLLIY